MKTTFIYGLYSSDDDKIRYVGKSDNPSYRVKRHIYQVNDSKTHKNSWIKKIIKDGHKLEYKILEEVLYDEWCEREKFWISNFTDLVNTAPGGLGGGVIKYKISYDDCKKWVRDNLSVKSKSEWYKEYIPDFIPRNPREVYIKRGWISWGDFLGTNKIQDNKKINYLSYIDAKKWINENKILFKNKIDYKNYDLPTFLPKRPERYYKNRGWLSWSDYLSNNRVQNQKRIFLTYYECIDWLSKEYDQIKSHKQWRIIRKNFPDYIPTNPNVHYINKGWTNWKDFFSLVNNRL
jgi:hypothetical protein